MLLVHWSIELTSLKQLFILKCLARHERFYKALLTFFLIVLTKFVTISYLKPQTANIYFRHNVEKVGSKIKTLNSYQGLT